MNDLGCFDLIVTQKEFARVVGLSEPVVSDLIGRGVIAKGGTLGTWIKAYIAQLRRVASGRGEGGAAQNDLTLARIRDANAKAFKAEVETSKDLGMLVYRDAVEPALRSWAARGAMALEGAERRIVDGIQSEFGITLEDRHVSDHLHLAQRDIAAYAEEFGADAETDRDGMAAPRTGTDG
jgi:phage terminase Nu1 subunit (DNA packaging protein)